MGSLYNKKLKERESLSLRVQNSVKDHSLLKELPEMCVPYSVRQVHGGKLTYFNFKLAKEMGMIPLSLEEKITPELEEAILNQFNLRIINEYDRINHTPFKSEDIKPFKCFSTRYLQLQHKNKQGRTSGDGRAIWNGEVTNNGKTWDLNSRGTGVTCLAPGMVQAGIPLKTGNEDYGYSCGLSELPEIYASSVMSERFHKQGISTERILVAIENEKDLGICVRAHENLLRPAHMFRYLKLSDHYGAKTLLSYCINRDFKNGRIKFSANHKDAFKKYLEYFSSNFLKTCAQAYHKEIFLWMDWDGDNILIDGGIIDYGSVRRFGAHHNKYKYDDDDRFSTCLDEQANKGKQTVQFFAQLIDFIISEEKKPVEEFSHHNEVLNFDKRFEESLKALFLKDIGLSEVEIKKSLRWRAERIDEIYNAFEKLKSRKLTKTLKTLDGENQWPALNMNVFLSDIKNLMIKKSPVTLKKYRADFTEYPTQNLEVELEALTKEMSSLVGMLKAFEKDFNLKFDYYGDFNQRLTTSAVLDLIIQIQGMSLKKYQKSLIECIEFGFLNTSKWVAAAKALYRDDL